MLGQTLCAISDDNVYVFIAEATKSFLRLIGERGMAFDGVDAGR